MNGRNIYGSLWKMLPGTLGHCVKQSLAEIFTCHLRDKKER